MGQDLVKLPGALEAKAEAMTPLWMCNLQNNLIDAAWFGREEVFNKIEDKSWTVGSTKIEFPTGKTWQDYVLAKRLEIACGKAPYLTGRYDILTRKRFPIRNGIGLLDRKLRIVTENTRTIQEWQKWMLVALDAIYGIEIQSDKVVRARRNLLLTVQEFQEDRFEQALDKKILVRMEEILQKNIVQADMLMEPGIFAGIEFDAIVGNPPYHRKGGAGGTNDAPIYPEFVNWSLGLDTRYVSLVIPARWFAGGRENLLGKFRRQMVQEAGLKVLEVFPKAEQVFPWVNSSGGICCFLAEAGFVGECEYIIHNKKASLKVRRRLDDADVIIRDPQLAEIVQKVEQKIAITNLARVETIISGNTPFGITSDLHDKNGEEVKLFAERTPEHDVDLYFFEKPQRVHRYVNRNCISKHPEWLGMFKVLLPAAGGTGSDRQILGKPKMVAPGTACSQSYLCAVFPDEEEAEHFEKYVRTRFFRALVKARKVSQSAARRMYRFVPLEDLSRNSDIDWSESVAGIERQLYEKYELTKAEIEYIEMEIADWED